MTSQDIPKVAKVSISHQTSLRPNDQELNRIEYRILVTSHHTYLTRQADRP